MNAYLAAEALANNKILTRKDIEDPKGTIACLEQRLADIKKVIKQLKQY